MPLRIRSKRVAPAAAANASAAQPPFGLPSAPPGWAQMPAGISLCMIVKNEERFLRACLESVKDAVDEINIVDTGSTDSTIAIAREFGARIEEHPWCNDFSWARNKALDMATRRWIFQLDADEELLPESIEALRQLKSAPSHLTGVWLRCVNSSDRYRGGGTISHAIIRIFPNHPRIRYKGAIHEFPAVDDSPLSMPAVVAPIKIVHHGYLEDVVADRGKYQRNMSIIEQSVLDHPEDAFHWYNLGMTAYLNGEYERSVPALEKMWNLCLEHGMRAFTANGLQILADVHSEHLNDPQTGLRWALRCLEKAPRYANAHFSAGKAYFLLQRYGEARQMYQKAIDDGRYMDRQFVVDDEVPAWKAPCEIGSTYAEEGDHQTALTWFEKALASRPKVQPLRVNYAKALEALGRFDEAQAVYQALLDDFGDELSVVDLVNFYLRRKNDRAALDLIDTRAATLSPIARVSMALAAAHVTRTNGWGDGIEHVLDALRVDPQQPMALAAAAEIASVSIQQAAAHEAASSMGAAEATLLRALPLARARVSVELAALYLRSGRLNDAKRVAEEALANA